MSRHDGLLLDEEEQELGAVQRVERGVVHQRVERDDRRSRRPIRVDPGPGEAVEVDDTPVVSALGEDREPGPEVAPKKGVLGLGVRLDVPYGLFGHEPPIFAPPAKALRREPFEHLGCDRSHVADHGDRDVVRLGEVDLVAPPFTAVADLRRRQWEPAAAQARALRSHEVHDGEAV